MRIACADWLSRTRTRSSPSERFRGLLLFQVTDDGVNAFRRFDNESNRVEARLQVLQRRMRTSYQFEHRVDDGKKLLGIEDPLGFVTWRSQFRKNLGGRENHLDAFSLSLQVRQLNIREPLKDFLQAGRFKR